MDQTAIQQGAPPPKPVETGIQGGPPSAGPNGTVAADAQPSRQVSVQKRHLLVQALHLAASLKITVVLLFMSLLLVFWGTLAQGEAGVWTVVSTYFRNFLVLIPIKIILFNAVGTSDIVIPYPGGLLIGTVMLVNLLAA